MNRAICKAALITSVVFIAASVASAQMRSGGGMGGNSGFGSSGFGSSGFGSSGFGSSGFGGGGMGRSGMGGMSGFGGSSAFGGGGFGGSGFGGSSAFGRGGGMGGSGFGGGGMGGGMGGGGMGGGQNFVGRDGGDMQAIMGQMGRAGTQFFSTMNRNMSNRNRFRQQQPTDGEENQRPPVRVRLEMGFSAPPSAPTVVATNLNARLAQLSVDHSVGQPQISVEGDTVVLRGTAESESQLRVLEQFVMLEPGVMRVRNEMVVAGQSNEEQLPVSSSN
jgi:hypothetical protein